MKRWSWRTFLTGLLFLSTKWVAAQEDRTEMADPLMQSGKIYVVVLVLCIIFAGLLTFLIVQEVRLRKLEREVHGQIHSNEED